MAASAQVTFPLLAGVQNGGVGDYNDTTYQAALAKLSLVILKYYPGFSPGGSSLASIIQALKAKNPALLAFLYVDMDGLSPAVKAMATLSAQIEAQGWWLKDASGNPVPSFYGAGENTINCTPFTSTDPIGNTCIDWITRWYAYQYAVAGIDGFFMDNVFPQPRVAGAWYEDGIVLQPSDPKAQAAIQAGYERYFSLIRTLMPGKLQLGNIGSWASGVPAGYQGMTDGGLFEEVIGAPSSIETYAGFAGMMNAYTTLMDAIGGQALVFGQVGSLTDYQSMRYGLCSCLLNDGYYAFNDSAVGYTSVPWFDEFSAPLGIQISAPPVAPWNKGVWRRDFAGGIALVNPKGNGTQTVTFPVPFIKLKGTQTSVNDGASVKAVTLADRDGLILLRTVNT